MPHQTGPVAHPLREHDCTTKINGVATQWMRHKKLAKAPNMSDLLLSVVLVSNGKYFTIIILFWISKAKMNIFVNATQLQKYKNCTRKQIALNLCL